MFDYWSLQSEMIADAICSTGLHDSVAVGKFAVLRVFVFATSVSDQAYVGSQRLRF
jgi:hypothetical protein